MINQLLQIDDDDMNCFILQRQLKLLKIPLEYKVIKNPEEAIQFLETVTDAEFPSVIFLDLNMPMMSGFDFLDRYVKTVYPQHQNTKIYVVSSSIQEEEKIRAKQYVPVVDFISKPVDENILLQISNSWNPNA